MSAEEGDDLPAVEVLPRRLAECVVTAGQPRHVERVSGVADVGDDVAGEIGEEGEIVARADEAYGARGERGESCGVGERARG